MSWNKNTDKSTKIDDTIEVLKENNILYTLDILGKVRAKGQNDYYNCVENYELRKLTYQNFVIMEQMIREDDCDVDDCIIAVKFGKDNVPENWELEVNDNKLEEE